MKISHLKVFHINPAQRVDDDKNLNLVYVKVYTDEGIDGLGEAFATSKARTAEAALYDFERMLKGQDPTEVLRIWNAYYRSSRFPLGTVTMGALSAIESALWDISGKAAGMPVYKMLGGPVRDKIQVYRSTGLEGIPSALERGFAAVKFTPQPDDYMDKPWQRVLDESVDRVRKTRELAGPDVDIGLDYHGRSLSPHEPIQFAKAVEPYRPMFLEEPVDTNTPASYAEIKAKTTIPIAGGERTINREQLREIMEHRAVHIFQPDPAACGGIMETIRWAAVAEVHRILLAPHNSLGPVQLAMSLHIDACVPNFFMQECNVNVDSRWVDELFDHVPVIEGGYLKLSERPGLGIELNEEAAAAYAFEPVDREVVRERDGGIGLF